MGDLFTVLFGCLSVAFPLWNSRIDCSTAKGPIFAPSLASSSFLAREDSEENPQEDVDEDIIVYDEEDSDEDEEASSSQ